MKSYLESIPAGAYKQVKIIGDCLLIQADCLNVLPHIQRVDACLTDPPYGIGVDGQKESKCNNTKHNRKYHEFKGWDSQRPDSSIFNVIQNTSDFQIIWGGNYFADILPVGRGWMVWDKGQYGLTMSDGEIAYSNLDKPLRIFQKNRAFLLKEESFHPTQKPISLMRWCIEQLPKDCELILDPFMGSGTTGVACAKIGRKFIGIELDEGYFDIACKRIEEAYKSPDLFIEAAKKPEQISIEL